MIKVDIQNWNINIINVENILSTLQTSYVNGDVDDEGEREEEVQEMELVDDRHSDTCSMT